ncbi:NADH-quinone oxidoreductase subunit J [Candidatus Doolittlea endobia]|uniref:NADH-quinone oxidoreductase subunit J n=1 Tax=Candidatus Doolittlea endobia TaxID=1778262 RepID=A0A143WSP8_9ENTR|nr:NADH-quinone oxidoreductase subunit J [Candidatus Doolittlea endobia]CUX96752.1 NADH-quinone oxidoreductase subunit J [Candidatus Doolittlea endobia]
MELAFYLSGLVAVLSTLRVITHTHPVHALLYLIISMLAITCVFFSLGAYFAGALEIIVYAGAIMVLFVFVVMMLNINVGRDKQECTSICLKDWIGPSLMSLVLLVILVHALADAGDHGISGDLITAKTVGIALFGPYVLAVELASVSLLAGLVVAFHLGHDDRPL